MPKSVTVRLDDGRAVARPGIVRIKPGDFVDVQNKTDYAIEVFVPKAGIKSGPVAAGSSYRCDLSKAGAGHYAYAVYCEEVDDFAEGNSSPKIIINP